MKDIILKTLVAFTLLTSAILHAETPNEGASVIHELIKERKYDILFPTRYSEWYKIEKEGIGKEEAVAKLSKMFEKQHGVLLSVYKQLSEATFTISEKENPQVSETGKVASATIELGSKEIPFKLYEMKDGTWGFHL
jgi:hypothetical protein